MNPIGSDHTAPLLHRILILHDSGIPPRIHYWFCIVFGILLHTRPVLALVEPGVRRQESVQQP